MKRLKGSTKPWRLMTPAERIAAIVSNKRGRDRAVAVGYLKPRKPDDGGNK